MKAILTILLISTGLQVLAQDSKILPEAEARRHLAKGAIVIDVRTVEEFRAQPLTNVVNIPLDTVTNQVPAQVPDKSTKLLLYCRSGRRSGIAESELRAMGYTNAFNIGSFEQARRVVSPSPAKEP